MKTFRKLAMTMTLTLSLSASAQDFGHPKDKAFYKAHWNEIVKDLGPDAYIGNAQYVLHDFNKDHSAELYLWLGHGEEYLYSIKNNKVVRVSETARTVEDEFWLGSFYAHFMAPYEMLLDKPVNQEYESEQHLYEAYDVPGIWFKLHPKVKGTFNIKTAIEAIYCFDCEYIGDALYALYSGRYDKEEAEEYVVDVQNGYAKYQYNTSTMNMVEVCYWNMANGEKLLAMHYHVSGNPQGDNVDPIEQTLFMKYNPKTKVLNPVVAPIQGFNFQMECNFSLPRKGKNITLIAADNDELKWTGSGFKY